MAGSTENEKPDGKAVRTTPNTITAGTAGKRRSRKKSKARRKAVLLSKGYVLFLAIMCIATVLMCIRYLKLKETITTQVKQNNELRTELATLRAENDATLEAIENSVDLAAIRDRAINEFGMKYATEDQVIWNNSEDNGYVEQYRDIS